MNGPDLVLHVGMQQSGATMLQRALAGIRPQLREGGIGFVSHGQLTELADIDGWAARTEPRSELAAGFADEVAALVDNELTKVQAGGADRATVLISSDHLLGTDNLGPADVVEFRPRTVPAIEQMVAAIDPERLAVVIHVQRQDRLMEFCYMRDVMAGGFHHLDAQFPGLMTPVLDYVELIRRIERIPRVDRVVVRPYELIGAGSEAFVADFLRTVGAPTTIATEGFAGLVSRVAYTPQGLQLARAMNPHLDDAAQRKRVRIFLRSSFGTSDESQCQVFTDRQRVELLEAYSEHNEELFRTWLPELPPESYTHPDNAARIVRCGLRHDQT